MDLQYRKEIEEAIGAADHALDCLYAAGDYLASARNWGIMDILGGGLISTLVKRSKMTQASACIDEAKRAMATFRRELADVDAAMPLAIDEAGFWGFADYFFDGFFADMMVQSQIAQARSQVAEAIERVTELRGKLVDLLNT